MCRNSVYLCLSKDGKEFECHRYTSFEAADDAKTGRKYSLSTLIPVPWYIPLTFHVVYLNREIATTLKRWNTK